MSLSQLYGFAIIIGLFTGVTAGILGWPMGVFVFLLFVGVMAAMGGFNE